MSELRCRDRGVGPVRRRRGRSRSRGLGERSRCGVVVSASVVAAESWHRCTVTAESWYQRSRSTVGVGTTGRRAVVCLDAGGMRSVVVGCGGGVTPRPHTTGIPWRDGPSQRTDRKPVGRTIVTADEHTATDRTRVPPSPLSTDRLLAPPFVTLLPFPGAKVIYYVVRVNLNSIHPSNTVFAYNM